MANVLKPRRSNTAGAVPTTAQLADGEFAVNTADKKIYVRAGASVVDMLATVGAAAWGNITGTLANQTDLQNALNLKANLTGAAFTGNNTHSFYGADSYGTGNGQGYISHIYDGATVQDVFSIGANWKRTSSTAGVIANAALATAEIEILAQNGGAGSYGQIFFRTGTQNGAPVTRMSLSSLGLDLSVPAIFENVSAPSAPATGVKVWSEGSTLKAITASGNIVVLAANGTGLTITWNPSDKHADITLSNGNLDATNVVASTWRSARGHQLSTTLKSYYEQLVVGGTSIMGGLADNTHDLSTYVGNSTGGTGGHGYALGNDGSKINGGAASACLGVAFAVGDTMMIAFDPVTRKLWFGRNGTWSGSPSAGTGEAFTVTAGYTYHPAMSSIANGHALRLRALASNQVYAPPTGFFAAAG